MAYNPLSGDTGELFPRRRGGGPLEAVRRQRLWDPGPEPGTPRGYPEIGQPGPPETWSSGTPGFTPIPWSGPPGGGMAGAPASPESPGSPAMSPVPPTAMPPRYSSGGAGGFDRDALVDLLARRLHPLMGVRGY